MSDIHFRTFSGDSYDVDEDLRNELILDINDYAKKTLSNIHGILVCGDIAFSGKDEEYSVASTFLLDICSILGIQSQNVYCVPGNHDVDQDIPRNSPVIKIIQDKLGKSKTNETFDAELAKFVRDNDYKHLVFAPIKCYNEVFAGKYNCYISPDDSIWKEFLPFDTKYQLCIFGMNSTIISNDGDHLENGEERKMLINQTQIPQRISNTIFLSLCHHPPECWNDNNGQLFKKMISRVSLQLYGHKHLQTVEQKNDSVIVGSGATHPSRFEKDWVPRYNWISLEIIKQNGVELLSIKIYPRIWSTDRFICDKELTGTMLYKEYTLKLTHEEKENRIENDVIENKKEDINFKQLVFDFLNLPYIKRDSIITLLSLGRDGDEGLKHVQFIKEIINRAIEQNCIKEFINLIKENKE